MVTTGTFSAMLLRRLPELWTPQTPHQNAKVWLNGIPACGIAAVDAYLGATELPEDDPCNSNYPGEFRYGGGHVIHDLWPASRSSWKQFPTEPTATRRELETCITLTTSTRPHSSIRATLPELQLCGKPERRTIYTYLGMLKPGLGNAHYCSAGQLSPLLNDPYFLTIGIGTRIFLRRYRLRSLERNTALPRHPGGRAGKQLRAAGGTLSLIGDLKQMKPNWLVRASILGYGATLMVGIGFPFPFSTRSVMRCVSVSDSDLYAPWWITVRPTANAFRQPGLRQLRPAEIRQDLRQRREVPTAPLSSYPKAREIAGILKQWIEKGVLPDRTVKLLLPARTALLPGHWK